MKRGNVTVITAPTMFAGKSDKGYLLSRDAELNGKRVIRLSHAIDMRGVDTPTTSLRHSGFVTPDVHKVSCLDESVDRLVADFDFVWIDEGQFFDGLLDAVRRWMLLGKDVVVSGLYLDFRGNPWGDLMDVVRSLPLREFHYLHADCTVCHEKKCAMHCPRIVASESVVLVGTKDIYKALCDKCFIVHVSESMRDVGPQVGTQ